jgi:hypothetical protein
MRLILLDELLCDFFFFHRKISKATRKLPVASEIQKEKENEEEASS